MRLYKWCFLQQKHFTFWCTNTIGHLVQLFQFSVSPTPQFYTSRPKSLTTWSIQFRETDANNHATSLVVWNHLFASLRTKEEIVVSKWDVDPILSYPMNSENHKLPPKSQFCKGRVQRSVNLLTAASVCYFFLTNVLKQNISEALSHLMIIS